MLPVVENLSWYDDLPPDMPDDVCKVIRHLYKLLVVASTEEDVRSILCNYRSLFVAHGVEELVLDMPTPSGKRAQAFVQAPGEKPVIRFLPWKGEAAA